MSRPPLKRLAAMVSVLAVLAVACGDDDDSADDAESTAGVTSAGGEAAGETSSAPPAAAATSSPAADVSEGTGGGLSGLLWDNGPCDASLDAYKIGIASPGENAVLTLIDQQWALEASIDAFNARGGIGGHCMEAVTCASDPDPNSETQCARDLVDAGVVVTVNDTTPFSGAGFNDVLADAGIPRFHDSPTSGPELASSIVYPVGAGGAGTTFMMAPPCAALGKNKVAAIHVDTPTIGGTLDAMEGIVQARGGELVARIPVPAGTTDFQQFILSAEDAGADCVVLPLGEQEATQVLLAGQALGTELTFSNSWGTFALDDIVALGDFGEQLVFNAELPPATTDQERWPILEDMLADLAASDRAELQPGQLKSSPARSWVGILSLVRVIEEFGDPANVTAEAVTSAIAAATDVDHAGLTPPWTPTAFVAPDSPFSSISQPWYYWGTYDNSTQSFVVADDRLNVMAELGGETDYPQP